MTDGRGESLFLFRWRRTGYFGILLAKQKIYLLLVPSFLNILIQPQQTREVTLRRDCSYGSILGLLRISAAAAGRRNNMSKNRACKWESTYYLYCFGRRYLFGQTSVVHSFKLWYVAQLTIHTTLFHLQWSQCCFYGGSDPHCPSLPCSSIPMLTTFSSSSSFAATTATTTWERRRQRRPTRADTRSSSNRREIRIDKTNRVRGRRGECLLEW